MRKTLFMLIVMILAGIGLSAAQTRKVSGVVISADDQEPIVGATVTVKGTKTQTVTDIDGLFTISAPPTAKYLVVTYIGMKPAEVAITDGKMNIELSSSAEELGEVVVTGMTKMDKRLFTGAATKIDAQDARIGGMADISRSLEGRAAGVSVQNVSGTFGTAPKIRVRGATSIYGSSKPLWVVDGVIMEDVTNVSADDLSSGNAETLISSAIAGLNADDIESFDILKDGSATSIYGARAMAGVIVVTTKKGKAGRNSLTYNGEFTMRLKPSYSTFNIMNSQDQMGIYQELANKGYLNYAEIANASSSGVYGKMYQLISEYDATSGQFGLANTPEARAQYLREAEYRNTDWFDQLFSTSVMQTHSISLSSGTEKAQHYVSASAMYDPGWYKQSNVQRYTANLNSNFNISDKVALNLISNASFRKQKAPGTLGSETDMVTGEVKRDFDINPYSYSMNTSRTLDANTFYTRNYAPFNILHELENNYMKLGVSDFRLTGILTYKPIKKVELSLLGGVQNTSTSQEHFILDDSNQAQAYRAMPTQAIRDKNPFLYTDPDDAFALPVSILPNGGIYERADRSMFKWDMRAAARYNDVFAEKHIVNFYAGMETNSVNRHSTWFRGWGMQYAMGEVANYAYTAFKRGKEENTQYYTLTNTRERSVAFFGNATYSYQGRYTLNGTLRYEGTNSLGKSRKSRWLPTWNVSGSWNAHEEEFWSDLNPTWSHLTLKASYSLTGDRPSVSNAYAVIGSKNPWRPTAGVTESELYVSQLANQDLTYEKKHELNLGLSTGFLDNRINVEFDWYRRNNYDLIGLATTQGIGGEIDKFGNIASMRSHGVELSLTTRNIVTKDFTWTTNLIYSHNKNKVTDLKTTKRMMELISGSGFAQQGYPVRSLFSIPFMGLNEEGLPTFLDQDGNISTTGIYFQTSDPEKLNFLEYSGSIDPTDVGSFGNIFRYKDFTLNVYVTYSFGNVVRLDPVFKKEYNDLTAHTKEFANRWTVPGDENKTNIPVIASKRQNKNDTYLAYAYNAYNYSTARVAKGDFIRMKEISLAYQVPQKAVSALRLSSAMLKLQATNLFLIYADKKLNGQDPEFFNTGGVAAPTPKQFTLTVNLGF
ncbi:MAG: SusC/RagA family TonB-linked outer membrane protein [Duncaniella sp.]|uniref:SusC/RagA family TonB-linked outer membrane protein n=1 Tax=Duncaniella sp. TaxID=2518496 RepID=UPI0023D02DED|nr:SusC/RagA family TonB-linked outer membrane protein [Duncaniella sp.]MDE6089374.1 SusC/RagA family TonB-linked outer membrane protein [Duncaniella sp.]